MRKSGSAPVVASDDGRPFLNTSQILEWAKCRYRWHLGVERTIQSRAVMRAPELGSMVHEGMAAVMRHVTMCLTGKVSAKKLQETKLFGMQHSYDAIVKYANRGIELRGGIDAINAEELELFQSLQEAAQRIVAQQIDIIDFERYRTVTANDGTPLVERAFNIDLPKSCQGRFRGVHGTIDWVLEDRELEAVFQADYKCRKAFTPPEAEEVNLQQTIYQRLLHKNGVNTEGTIMFQIKANPPKEPEMLKSGKAMSRAAIVTTWGVYEEALVRNGLNPDDYREDMKPKLDAVEWNRIEYTYRSLEEVESIWKKIVLPAAKEIGQLENSDQRAFHFFACNGCWARAFCLAELRGEDLDFLLQTQYVDMNNPKNRIIMNPDDFVFMDNT